MSVVEGVGGPGLQIKVEISTNCTERKRRAGDRYEIYEIHKIYFN